MIVNCELPKCLYRDNDYLNDYDFILYHLYSTDDQYKYFFKKSHKSHPHRITIFDNSAYEFFIKGCELSNNLYIENVNDFQPDIYILPDVLMDKEKTLQKTSEFLYKYSKNVNNNSKPMAVIQGNNAEEMLECLKEYINMGIEHIAIPFHNSFFSYYPVSEDVKNIFIKNLGKINNDIKYAIGRVQFIKDNINLIKNFKWVHVLGSHCPFEKVFYKDLNSMDTSYPVKCALGGYKLFSEPSKPNIIIDDFINNELTSSMKNLIIDNIEAFKKL